MSLFGKGKIEMLLSKYNYMPGESITGNLNLLMKKKKKPVTARGLSVALVGRETRTWVNSEGERQSATSEIFDVKIPLDGEKQYTGGAYKFDIRIPETILEGTVVPPEPEVQESKAMKAAKVARFLYTGKTSPKKPRITSRVNWYVIANLDIPRRFDLINEAEITIG